MCVTVIWQSCETIDQALKSSHPDPHWSPSEIQEPGKPLTLAPCCITRNSLVPFENLTLFYFLKFLFNWPWYLAASFEIPSCCLEIWNLLFENHDQSLKIPSRCLEICNLFLKSGSATRSKLFWIETEENVDAMFKVNGRNPHEWWKLSMSNINE